MIRAARDVLAYQRHCLALAGHNKRPGAAHHFTGDNHDLALAGLFLGKSPILAIGLAVLWFDVTAEIDPVNLDFAAQFGLVWIMNLRAHRFAEFVQQNEAALWIDVQVTADL